MGWVKNMVRKWLDIQPAQEHTISIKEAFNFESNLDKNIIWFRGNASELHQFYTQKDDCIGNNSFWASKPTNGMNIRKIHTGLPFLIVKMLSKVVTDDMGEITINCSKENNDKEECKKQEIWNNIAKENKFKKIIRQAVIKALYMGDGAFKVSYDDSISQYPIIEFFGADRVDFIYNRGRIEEIIFKTRKFIKSKEYVLKDHYYKGGVFYSLENSLGEEVDLKSFEEFSDLKDATNSYNFIMAVPFKIEESEKFEGRGKAIFDTKEGAFDSFDEVWSQWVEAVRKGRVKTYIPENLIPRDPNTGRLLKPNEFDCNFIATEKGSGENDKNEIVTKQGEIPADKLLSTYTTALDLCLQGLISPSTLGIDVKKLDNGEAQREKEKATLYSRNEIVQELQEVIKEVVTIALKVYELSPYGGHASQIEDYIVDVPFGEYANPSFEAQVETIGKASTTNIMSIEAQVEELWGDTKDKNWKEDEIRRLKEERGILEVEEPSVSVDGL